MEGERAARCKCVRCGLAVCGECSKRLSRGRVCNDCLAELARLMGRSLRQCTRWPKHAHGSEPLAIEPGKEPK